MVGCVQKKNMQPVPDKEEVADSRQKDSSAIDYVANEMEDLGISDTMKNVICQNWDFYEDARDARSAEPSQNIELVYRGYSIFGDGTVIKNPRGNIRQGKWTMNENTSPKTVSFYFDNAETETYLLVSLMPFEMKLLKKGADKKDFIDLRGEGVRYIDVRKDPFYISNNLWRFKPSKPETDEQIKSRLKSCIHFFELFYEHKIRANSNEVVFVGLPSCFKWYDGAIYLQKERELNSKWINSFYDKDQAMKAYKLADKLMDNKFEWPKNESNWLKMNLAVLKQMEKKLDAISL